MFDRAARPETGLSGTEIELTPAMIEAGLEEYRSVWTDLRDAQPGVAEVMLREAFRAMTKVQLVRKV